MTQLLSDAGKLLTVPVVAQSLFHCSEAVVQEEDCGLYLVLWHHRLLLYVVLNVYCCTWEPAFPSYTSWFLHLAVTSVIGSRLSILHAVTT